MLMPRDAMFAYYGFSLFLMFLLIRFAAYFFALLQLRYYAFFAALMFFDVAERIHTRCFRHAMLFIIVSYAIILLRF